MILTGENKILWKKSFSSATFFATNFTCTGLRSKRGLRGDKRETRQIKDQVSLNFI